MDIYEKNNELGKLIDLAGRLATAETIADQTTPLPNEPIWDEIETLRVEVRRQRNRILDSF